MAARWGNLEAAKALLELGAHVSTVSRNTGMNAEEEAAQGGHDSVAKYLRQHKKRPAPRARPKAK